MNPPVTITERLDALRVAMRHHDVAACLIPSADPHLSEYLPAHWQARQWLSGFSGSAGTLIVSVQFAGLWTDSRYFEQAAQQLDGSGIELMRLRVPHMPEHIDWLADHLGDGDALAVAGDSLSLHAEQQLRDRLAEHGAKLRCDVDLPAEIWTARPPLPGAAIHAHPPEYAIVARSEKLRSVRAAIAATGASHHLLSSLDDIGWLTNLRGSDVDYNPVFLAHLLVAQDSASLFVDASKIDATLASALQADGIDIRPYSGVTAALVALPTDAEVLLDPGHIVVSIGDAIPAAVAIVAGANPSTAMKAIKGTAELDRIREVMRRDGAALVHGFRVIMDRVASGSATTELDVANILLQARAAQPDFRGESFATIAAYAAHGALPHYQATPAHHAALQPRGLLLVDSGGQYLGGTTDITRVWALGPLSKDERHDCTVVLQGMIELSRARFPRGASGPQLDALARAPLWAVGADYGHGTGHGVGYFLNVHEGPQGIRPPMPGGALVALVPGMITSIEPGLYKPGRHGIRHENLAVVKPSGRTEFGEFLDFETLTLCPFDTLALDPAVLTTNQRAWLNAYHQRVESELSPLLDSGDRAWLAARCKLL